MRLSYSKMLSPRRVENAILLQEIANKYRSVVDIIKTGRNRDILR